MKPFYSNHKQSVSYSMSLIGELALLSPLLFETVGLTEEKQMTNATFIYPISWICYERSSRESYLSMWNQLAVHHRLQLLYLQSSKPHNRILQAKLLFRSTLVKK